MKKFRSMILRILLCMLMYTTLASATQWTEYRITTSPANQYGAAISGNTVVWGAATGENPKGADINDIGNPIYFNIPDGGSFDIEGDTIVYKGNGTLNIYEYNLSTSSGFLISSNGKGPSTDGKTVVYVNGSVRGYDLFWGSNFSIPGSVGTTAPKVDGDIIIWLDMSGGIWGFKISTWEKFLISKDGGNSCDISDNLVVVGNNDNIYCFDISNPYNPVEFPICTDGNYQRYPAISGNIIVWQDNRDGNWSIYGYDISTQAEFKITNNSAVESYPAAISGHTVVWTDNRNGQMDIYATILYGPLVPKCLSPLQGDLNNDCKIDFKDFALMTQNWLGCNLDPPSACWE